MLEIAFKLREIGILHIGLCHAAIFTELLYCKRE